MERTSIRYLIAGQIMNQSDLRLLVFSQSVRGASRVRISMDGRLFPPFGLNPETSINLHYLPWYPVDSDL